MLADLIVRRGPLAEQADAVWRRVPQRLINVARDDYNDDEVRKMFEEIRANYGIEIDERATSHPSFGHRTGRSRDDRGVGRELRPDEFSQRIQSFFSRKQLAKAPKRPE